MCKFIFQLAVTTAFSVIAAGSAFSSQAAELRSQGSVLLTSDYLYRGISQTDSSMALQGAITVQHDSGWYVSAWGSNVQFADANVELDIAAGRSWQLAPDWTLDLGLMQYRYPNSAHQHNDFNFVEAYARLAFSHWQLGLALTDNYFGAGVGKFWYLTAAGQQPLTQRLHLKWHFGYNQFADAAEFQTFLGAAESSAAEYTDWQIGLGAQYLGLDWSVAYAGTSIDKRACAALCEQRWLFSLGKSF